MKSCSCGRSPVMVTTIRARVRTARVECPCGKTTGLVAWTKPKDTLEMKEAVAVVWDTIADNDLPNFGI